MSDAIDGEMLDTAECTAVVRGEDGEDEYPDRCTHTRCLLRERDRLQAALTTMRDSVGVAERERAIEERAALYWSNRVADLASEIGDMESALLAEQARAEWLIEDDPRFRQYNDGTWGYQADDDVWHYGKTWREAADAARAATKEPR